jgi:hypothetical protein
MVVISHLTPNRLEDGDIIEGIRRGSKPQEFRRSGTKKKARADRSNLLAPARALRESCFTRGGFSGSRRSASAARSGG